MESQVSIFEIKTVRSGNFKEWLNCCGIELCLILIAVILLALLALGCIPLLTEWKCPFSALTGCPCFSCGMTRALTALLHGNLLEAFKFNPFSLLLVGLLFFRLYQRLSATMFKSYLDFRKPRLIWGGMAALALLYGLLRIVFR
jgi:hypothetical protein